MQYVSVKYIQNWNKNNTEYWTIT